MRFAFAQAYIAAALRDVAVATGEPCAAADMDMNGYARLLNDCTAYCNGEDLGGGDGATFWRLRQSGTLHEFRPVELYRAENGKLHVREIAR